MIAVKIHNASRRIVALCDSALVGKKLEQDKRQLEARASFFKEKELGFEEAVKLIKFQAREDATFNIVGHNAIKAAIEAGLIDQDGVDTIEGVPFTLVLL